ncbi:hypothetical protein IV43_GL001004 [Ligilactobacillus acidipiscis]|uniref:Uncharacterized protein n=1 Tax=Ligilactobacillus acidipiscis TaxID=89059 RepID=A0A0R2K5V2_9LACO|nr:hypothetical protein IV43_GL001004 [Ligilactobacillus acidipiscis]
MYKSNSGIEMITRVQTNRELSHLILDVSITMIIVTPLTSSAILQSAPFNNLKLF